MDVTIRFGNLADEDDVTHGDSHVPPRILKWKLRHQEIVVAKYGEDHVGYLRLEHLWSKYPYIGLIVVHPDCRKSGIGKGMLTFLEQDLRTKGHPALYSSSQVNESAPQEWHRRMGFQECGMINGINEGSIGEVFFVKKLV